MGKVKDISGQRFGELTVIEDTGNRKRGSGVVWLCRCSCGKMCEKSANVLRQGIATSCGHDKKRRGKPKDISGMLFGELTAIEPTDKRVRGSVVWKCRCSCGKECEVTQHNLSNGLTTSCGHKRRADLAGERFGRLVAIRPLRSRSRSTQYNVSWLCKCDCGNVAAVPGSILKIGGTRSCGCIPKRLGRGFARCPSCGKTFKINTDGNPTPQFCPECAPKYSDRNWKVCPVCGKLFPSPASDKTVTCSKECSSEWKRIAHERVSNQWNEEAKEKKREEGQTDNLKMGTEAAKKSPIAGRFETNQEAKVWTLVDPSGNEAIVRNLSLWARENTERFGKPEGDKSADQIVHGFYAIAQTLKGKRKTPSMTYFGWTLKDVPKEPEE